MFLVGEKDALFGAGYVMHLLVRMATVLLSEQMVISVFVNKP